MARKFKVGLDYFPVDVDFFDDDKIQIISGEFGIKGELITLRLLAKIYSTNGYYYQWGDDESILFAKRVGDGITHSFVNSVVSRLVSRGFFDKSIFDRSKIITSRGIQKRYFEACERRKKVDVVGEILLVNPSDYVKVNINYIDDYFNYLNADINSQSKVKRKKTESKPGEILNVDINSFIVQRFISVYSEIFPDFIRDPAKDNFSARRIFDVISKNGDAEATEDQCVDVWRNICEALRDKQSVQFYAGNGLNTIANNLPTIIQKIRDGKNGNRKDKQSPGDLAREAMAILKAKDDA